VEGHPTILFWESKRTKTAIILGAPNFSPLGRKEKDEFRIVLSWGRGGFVGHKTFGGGKMARVYRNWKSLIKEKCLGSL